ncbi:type VII secretion target [Mycolicibacterium nivoides]|uniref:type VII secretion target n=1 Tax=Mycolicibacterium nivoides TaxID=2487344 RepID=UPI000F5BAD31|nr:type VII secretion target [Mycolicibacterium nivoides]
MANELEVDAGGLRVAAAGSDGLAAGLAGGSFDAAASAQPSGAGVAAMNAALTSVKSRQSARITGQADDLSVSSARYDSTDTDGGDAITAVSV